MFERYTERARRVVFFARYEASQLGGAGLETEHLLLGLIREGKSLTSRLFNATQLPKMDEVRRDVEVRWHGLGRLSTSVEIPLSPESRRVLDYACEEAERMRHKYIAPEHILLALLREERSVAAQILLARGFRLDALRDEKGEEAAQFEQAADTPNLLDLGGQNDESRRHGFTALDKRFLRALKITTGEE